MESDRIKELNDDLDRCKVDLKEFKRLYEQAEAKVPQPYTPNLNLNS
jgi:hypothetical protein